MTKKEQILENVATIISGLEVAQNPAWPRPTDKEIIEVLQDILVHFDAEEIVINSTNIETINDKIDDIERYISDAESYIEYAGSEISRLRNELDRLNNN